MIAALSLAVATGAKVGEEPADASLPLRVASYNTWLLPLTFADETEERDAQMGNAIDALEPDIVCLQEVWTERAFEPIAADLAARLPSVATGGGALAILARWPVHDTHFEPYPSHEDSSFIEDLAGKGWLTTLVDTPAGVVRIVNTHLIHDRSDERAAHAAQLALLLEFLQSANDAPIILCGDLNMRAFRDGEVTAGYAALQEAGFEDAATTSANRREGTRVGWPREGQAAHSDPDYVMFRDGDAADLSLVAFRQALDTTETALSDHNLQLADLVLVQPAVSSTDAASPH